MGLFGCLAIRKVIVIHMLLKCLGRRHMCVTLRSFEFVGLLIIIGYLRDQELGVLFIFEMGFCWTLN